MDLYDILMILVLVGATLFGAWKGLAWQIASLASLVVSYFVALRLSPQLAPLFGSEPWHRLVAMLILYVATSLVIWTLFRIVGGAIDRLKLREFDRQIGALFGLAKGALLCVLITLFAVSLLPEEQKQMIIQSRSGYYVALGLDRSDSIMPSEIREMLSPYIRRAQQTLDPDENEPSTRPSPIASPPTPPQASAPLNWAFSTAKSCIKASRPRA